MSKKVLISKQNIQNIADAIRTKAGTSSKYTPIAMPSAILAFPASVPYNWMGANVECISSNFYSSTIYLNTTTYSTWTASTTAKSLKATTSLDVFTATDMNQYAYLIRWVVEATVSYLSTATLKVLPLKEINLFDQYVIKRPSSLDNIENYNFNSAIYVNTQALSWMRYYNASGDATYTWAAAYGFYAGAPTPAFTGSTNTSPSVTFKTPSLYARCSSTLFSVDRYNDIDINNTYWHMHAELYRMDASDCAMHQRYKYLMDRINDNL